MNRRHAWSLALVLTWTSAVHATTYYIAPHGDDSHRGTSTTAPKRTFGEIFGTGTNAAGQPRPVLGPGDTLVIDDGTYTTGTTGLLDVDCAINAANGRRGAPITIRAASERQAAFVGSGTETAAVHFQHCAWYVVEGLYARNVDAPTRAGGKGYALRFGDSTDFVVRRTLGVHPNRLCGNSADVGCNSMPHAFERTKRFLIEEIESYDYHRHGFSLAVSEDLTIRRSYANAYPTTATASADVFPMYPCDRCRAENVIGEYTGSADIERGAQTIFGGLNPFGAGHVSQGQLVSGGIALNTSYGAIVKAREYNGGQPVYDAIVRDFVAVRPQFLGAYVRSSVAINLDGLSLLGPASKGSFNGLQYDQEAGAVSCSAPQVRALGPCGGTVTNTRVQGFGGRGMHKDPANIVTVTYSNSAGNGVDDYWSREDPADDDGAIRASGTTLDPTFGADRNQCVVWLHPKSPLRGRGAPATTTCAADAACDAFREACVDGRCRRHVGAVILYASENGRENRALPLWRDPDGRFRGCGATVRGVNDDPRHACIGVAARLNVNANGCDFPAGYVGWGAATPKPRAP